jgi:DNA-directed RNA polymerase specialized sigma subunit
MTEPSDTALRRETLNLIREYPFIIDPLKISKEEYRLKKLLKKIEKMKEIARLRYKCHKSLQEISEIYGVSRQAIDSFMTKYKLK